MVIEPKAAVHFIAGYQALLAEAAGKSADLPHAKLVALLAEVREAVAADPARIDAAAAALEAQGKPVAADVVQAVKTLRLAPWVYLRDTTRYSVFVDATDDAAYAVLGLTDRLRDLLGDSGVVIRTGVLEYRGRYVCDGVVANPLWLGANLRREFNEKLARLKKSGGFHAACETGAVAPSAPTRAAAALLPRLQRRSRASSAPRLPPPRKPPS